MRYQGQHFLVIGIGRSGRAALQLLLRHGAQVSAYDRDTSRLENLEPGVTCLSGPEPPDFEAFDHVVTSPGFPATAHPKLMPEIDLAASHLASRVIGVTGTNGKSTTTVLIGEMLRRSGMAVPVGGNLGDPLCTLAEVPADCVVAELSSFQLEHAHALRVSVAVLLNLSPDHLERHGTLESYATAKARLTTLQKDDDTVVVNLDDPWAARTGKRATARTLGFSQSRKLASGASLDGQDLVLHEDGREILRISQDQLSPACRAPIGNSLAASLAAHTAGATPEAIRSVLKSFAGLPHRARLVCTRQRVRYVDDSKATNPAAAVSSLASQPASVLWLAGGRNKGLDFTPLVAATRHVRAAVLFGEAAAELAATLRGATPLVQVETLDQALQHAAGRAQPGDTVLLAPACSSLDQFDSFEARGRHFIELARALPGSTRC